MKFVSLIFTSVFVLLECSRAKNEEFLKENSISIHQHCERIDNSKLKTNYFDLLDMPLHALIGSYLENPDETLQFLNKNSFSNFEYSLKFYVEEIFGIKELS